MYLLFVTTTEKSYFFKINSKTMNCMYTTAMLINVFIFKINNKLLAFLKWKIFEELSSN